MAKTNGLNMKPNGSPRARSPIEREYLATLNAAVPLDTWQATCKRAADDALARDAKARDWLAKWLLGLESRLLTLLVAEESGGRRGGDGRKWNRGP